MAKPPTLDVKTASKNDVSIIIRQPHCKEHGADIGYVHGYALYYYPANDPGMQRLWLIIFFLDFYRVFQKTDTQFYFWDNFSNSAPILTILSLLQAEIYGA